MPHLTESSPGPARRPWLRLAIGLPLFAIICWLVGQRLLASLRQIRWNEIDLSYVALAAALAVLVLARLTNGLNCRALLASLGQHAPLPRVTAIIWLASLGRYLPGKMAVVAGAAVMLNRLGVPLPAALAALFLSSALMIIMSLLTCLPLLFTPTIRHALPGGWLVGLAILVAGFICLQPGIFTRLCNLALLKLRRTTLPERLASTPLLHALTISLLRSLLLAAALFLTAAAVAPVRLADFPLILGAASLASVAGFLAVFAPAGLGVHEGIYLLTLGPALGPAAALLILLNRLLHLLADILTASAALPILARRPAPAPAHTVQ